MDTIYRPQVKMDSTYFSSMNVWLSLVTSQMIFSSSAISIFGLSKIAAKQTTMTEYCGAA